MKMHQKNANNGVLKVFGVILILFGLLYAVVGTLAVLGKAGGVLPGHDAQEMLVIVLAYAAALLALICGIAGLSGSLGVCKILGILLAVIGLAALIYTQLTQDAFNFFDCATLVLGAGMYGAAKAADK